MTCIIFSGQFSASTDESHLAMDDSNLLAGNNLFNMALKDESELAGSVSAGSHSIVDPSDSLPRDENSFETNPSVLRTRNKLQLLLPSDIVNPDVASAENFAEVVKERTRLRRERENAAVSTLTVQISRLEAALQAESKRRAKTVHAIKQQAQQEIQQMEETLRKQIHEETILVGKRLIAIEDRLTILEQRWQGDVSALNTDLERNRREIENQLKELYSAAEKEKQTRMAREQMLLKQLESVSKEYQERWTQERQDRLLGTGTIEEALKEQSDKTNQTVMSFEQKIRQELHLLSADLEREVAERRGNDDEIVGALNRYTAQLQQTLAYATSG